MPFVDCVPLPGAANTGCGERARWPAISRRSIHDAPICDCPFGALANNGACRTRGTVSSVSSAWTDRRRANADLPAGLPPRRHSDCRPGHLHAPIGDTVGRIPARSSVFATRQVEASDIESPCGTVVPWWPLLHRLGCYQPERSRRRSVCADGGLCPDGLHCASRPRCYRVTVVRRSDVHRALPHLRTSATMPPSAASAIRSARTGAIAGGAPVVNGVSKCAVGGQRWRGDKCNLSDDDCGAGHGCVRDCCGTNLGRCRQFCGGPRRAVRPPASTATPSTPRSTACDAPPIRPCDPVGEGPAVPTLRSAATSRAARRSATARERSNRVRTASSTPTARPGSGASTFMATQVCRVVCAGTSDCAPSETCDKSLGGQFGFCRT